jgi:hypothetical protein
VCIYSKDKSIDRCNDKLKEKFAETIKWFNINGLTLSADKSTLCTFTRKRTQLPQDFSLSEDLRIPYKNTVKYLEVILDKKLLWKDHILYTVKRAENGINILRVFCHQKWGADPNIALMFYKAYVRSILDYASQFYGSAAETHLNKIEVIKNKCLGHCVGYLKSTPIMVLEAETAEPPLHLRRNYLSDKLLIKLISKNSI